MSKTQSQGQGKAAVHGPSLLAALAIMLGGTLYPPLLSTTSGRADHTLVLLACWAMSAGFVRGVGFMPRRPVLRMILSGWACLLAIALFVLLRGVL